MEATLKEMWDKLSTKDREKYDSKAEKDRKRQMNQKPVLIKGPALYEFVLGFCARISDRHGKRSIRRLHGCCSCRIYANFDAHLLFCR
jgi:hypothetical protein